MDIFWSDYGLVDCALLATLGQNMTDEQHAAEKACKLTPLAQGTTHFFSSHVITLHQTQSKELRI